MNREIVIKGEIGTLINWNWESDTYIVHFPDSCVYLEYEAHELEAVENVQY